MTEADGEGKYGSDAGRVAAAEQREACGTTPSNVGASLLAMADLHSKEMLADPPPSRAGSLLQGAAAITIPVGQPHPMLRCAAIDSVGIAQMPMSLVHDFIERGQLVVVLPDWAPRTEMIYAVFASRQGMLPSMRMLIDFMVEQFRLLDDPARGMRGSPLV
ncbi:LysR substrate-binding domain-containing protein [Pseudomonas mandelii]